MLTETCIFCGSTFKLPDELQGEKVKCPRCKEVLGIAARRGKAEPSGGEGDDRAPATEPPVSSVPSQPVEAPVVLARDLLYETEEVVLETRPSVAAVILRLAAVVVAVIGVVITNLVVSPAFGMIGIAILPTFSQKIVFFIVCSILAAGVSVLVWVNWTSTAYLLSSSRVVSKKGSLRLRVRSLPLERVTLVDAKVGILQRLLGVGSVVIGTGHMFSSIVWKDVDDPQVMAKLIAQHVDHRNSFLTETQEALRKRGV